MFYCEQLISDCEKNKSLYFIVIKINNGRYTYLSQFISVSVTNTPGHLLQQLNTHGHFVNLISLSGLSRII